MDEIRPKRFINCYVPMQECNFRCEYCYIRQRKEFNNSKLELQYPLSTIKEATTVKRLGGICIFNLCAGGETLLSLNIISIIKVLLENGHNVSIVTNGTISQAFDKLLEFNDDLLNLLYIKFSFHLIELKKHNLLNIFFENVHKMQRAGVAISIDITPYDELVPYIPEIKSIFETEMDGAMPHISVARDTTSKELKLLSKMSKEEYKKVWSVFGSAKFDYKIDEFLRPHREYCYAGNASFSLEIVTGNCRICDGAPEPKKMDFYNLYKNPTEPIPFVEIGNRCPTAHCYNCHALLTLGTIPEIKTPTYAQMLDRVDNKGRHWLSYKMQKFYSQKLLIE